MHRPSWIFAPLFLAIIPQTLYAQTSQADLVRPAGAADLNGHLAHLASNPRDVSALIGAGEAALSLDDPRAAAGFFARADAIESGNGRIKAGLGRVMVKLQNPAEALRLFDQAVRLGYPESSFLGDRGLARDMTGDQAGAQRDYQAALARTPDDAELLRRYAASLGISGQVEAADKILQPLLYRSDRAAWRYRAFILAMNNRQGDARKIAEQTMPPLLVTGLTPYMQKMPYLTAAQKAAAVHFGHFPTSVGTKIAAITPTAPPSGQAVTSGSVTRAPAQPVAGTQASARDPSSARRRDRGVWQREGVLARAPAEASGRKAATGRATVPPAVTPATVQPVGDTGPAPVRTADARDVSPRPAATAAGQPTPATRAPEGGASVQSAGTPVTPPTNQTARPAEVQVAEARVTPFPARSQSVPAPSAPPTTSSLQGPPAPGFETTMDAGPPSAPGSSVPSQSPLAPAPVQQAQPVLAQQADPPPSVPAPDPAATRTLADIIRAIDVPDSERQPSVAAVDLAEIEALQAARRAERQAVADKAKKAATVKAKAEADAKAKAEAAEKARLAANPSRNWVQIATGANKGALGFTLTGLRKKYPGLAAQDAWIASWGRTNRLVVGPFASFTRAQALEKALKADGADVFAWKSDAGEDVMRFK
jgi:Flp pilus assembly protein TadD